MSAPSPAFRTSAATISAVEFGVDLIGVIRHHDLRHVGSRLDLNSGMPENELQAKLGHASPITTQRYSGRLMDRSGRKSAKKVFAERDLQAKRSADKLTAFYA